MKFKLISAHLTVFALLLVFFPCYAQSSSQQEVLQQYVAELQKNPSDAALREKTIKLAQEMKPAPAVPEEARRHYVKASTLLEDAKQPSDSADAAEEFRQALLVAPWWGDAYMKMGLALETAQRYDDAIASLKLFMVTKPQDEVLRKTQDEIYKIEAKREKAAKESSTEVAAAQEQKKSEDWLKKLDGRRYTLQVSDPGGDVTAVIDIRSTVAIVGIIYGQNYQNASYRGYKENRRFEIRGRETTIPVEGGMQRWWKEDTFIISEDGEKITVRRLAHDGERRESDYLLER